MDAAPTIESLEIRHMKEVQGVIEEQEIERRLVLSALT